MTLVILWALSMTVFSVFLLIKQPRVASVLQVTINDIMVIQQEFIDLETLLEDSPRGSISWYYFPPSPPDIENKVKIEVIRK